MEDSADRPWICPRCGEPTNQDVCPTCLHERPLDNFATNDPSSYLGIAYGPRGCSALPRWMAVTVIAGWVIGFAILILGFILKMR
jgi:hypothetical protein